MQGFLRKEGLVKKKVVFVSVLLGLLMILLAAFDTRLKVRSYTVCSDKISASIRIYVLPLSGNGIPESLL